MNLLFLLHMLKTHTYLNIKIEMFCLFLLNKENEFIHFYSYKTTITDDKNLHLY